MKLSFFSIIVFSIIFSSVFAQSQNRVNVEISSLDYKEIIQQALADSSLIIEDEYDENLTQITIDASYDGYDCHISILTKSKFSYSHLNSSSTTRKEKRCKKKVKKFMSKHLKNLIIH